MTRRRPVGSRILVTAVTLTVLAVAGVAVAVASAVDTGGTPPYTRAHEARATVAAPTVVSQAGGDPTDTTAVRAAPSSVPPPPGQRTAVTTTRTIVVNGIVRRYDVVAPTRRTAARLPVLLMLHARSASTAVEEARDGFLPLARAGIAVLVYPAGVGRSWNAGACCGVAHATRVDDVGFVVALVASIRSDASIAASRVELVGYSNGGKLAYDVVCNRPSLVRAVAIVAAVPVVGCPAGPPVSLLQIAGTADSVTRYDGPAGVTVNGFREPTVLQQVESWRARDRCTGAPAVRATGRLRTTTWSVCAAGTRLELATYAGAPHAWPVGNALTPSAARVVWQFLDPTPVVHAA